MFKNTYQTLVFITIQYIRVCYTCVRKYDLYCVYDLICMKNKINKYYK